MSQTVAIVLAAGAGRRLGAQSAKALVSLEGKPVVAWSLEAFEASPEIDRTVLVVGPSDRLLCLELVATLGLRKLGAVVDGGDTRHDSEFNGLEALAPEILDGSVSRVLVHDAARPFVDLTLVRRLLQALTESPGAIPALPAPATLVSRSGADLLQDFVRDAWAVQTPQAFRARQLLDAHRRAHGDGFRGTDTASVLERTGQAVAVVDGSPDAIKITAPVDLLRAQLIAKRLKPSPPLREG